MEDTELFGEISKEEAENPSIETVIERSKKMDELRVNDILTYEQFEESGLRKEWQKRYFSSSSYFRRLGEIINSQDYEAVAKFLADTYGKAIQEEEAKNNKNDRNDKNPKDPKDSNDSNDSDESRNPNNPNEPRDPNDPNDGPIQ